MKREKGLTTPGTLKSKLEKIRRFFAKQMGIFKSGQIPKMHLILDHTI